MSGLTLTDVAVRRAQRDIVAGIDLHAQPGQVLGLIGPNGAGKSTLLRAISGSLAISAGQIRFEDADLLTMKRRDRAQLMALVEQSSRAELGITVRQAVDLGRTPHRSLWGMGEDSDDELVDAAMKQVGIDTFADRDLETLSGGEQQRVHLARAIAQAPQLLLLDEPTNHLDLAAQAHTLGLIRSLANDGVTVVAALHDLNSAAAVCDQVVVLARGAIQAAGSPAQVLTAEIIESTYGVGVDVMTHPRTGRPVITLA